jgi:hypothetical protein
MRTARHLVPALVALAVGACGSTATFPAEARDPQIFGEIVRIEEDDVPDFFVHLRGGLRDEIHLSDGATLVDDEPDVGELYLTGGVEDDQERWYAFLPRAGDCWVMSGPARRDGDRLLFVNGLRLRISDTVDWGAAGELADYSDPRTRFCIDEMGSVAGYLGPG